jgi:serine/threonine protein kinase/WD40 repeat protein
MTLASGSKLGPYEIVSAIGAGGMGEVYRARDPRVGREVAIKVAAEQFNERFEREARAVAALNHPNICTLYDVGPDYIVMELVEGETLEEKLAGGTPALQEALQITRQIADALEAAHEKGIIHRDLKPGNIKIRPDGTVKVLDFGLAKVAETQAVSLSNSPTLSVAATQQGVILGTAGYMSPEQARGKTVDKRADIWAFGVILYEMLTGRRLFEGDTVSDTLAAVLTKELDWDRVPTKARPLLRRCLYRDPKGRLRDIGEVSAWLDVAPESAPTRRRRPLWGILAIALVAALVLAGAAFLAGRAFRSAHPLPVMASLLLDSGQSFPRFFSPPAVSPDGKQIVFAAHDEQGMESLWLRPLDIDHSVRLKGTENGSFPFWSPDGKSIGFFANNQLRTIEASGGPARTLCSNVQDPGGASWSDMGAIVLAGNGSLLRVSSSGGKCVPALNQESIQFPLSPAFLPDGHRFLFGTGRGNPIFVGDLETGKFAEVIPRGRRPIFVPPDWLLYEQSRTIYAARIDLSSQLRISEPVRLMDDIQSPGGRVAYSVGGKVLVAIQYKDSRQFQTFWMDRHGQATEIISTKADGWGGASLSGDGKRLALGGNALAIHDIGRGVDEHVGADAPPPNPFVISPSWSPRGDLLASISMIDPLSTAIHLLNLDKGTNEEIFRPKPKSVRWLDWFPDGRNLGMALEGEPGPSFSQVVSFSIADRKEKLLFASSNRIADLRVSPLGEWIAYVSDETGRPEVFLRRVPGQAMPIQVSQYGGQQPRWKPDGKELFYVAPDNSIMGAAIPTNPSYNLSKPRSITGARPQSFFELWAVSTDAQRFLVQVNPIKDTSFSLLLDWASLAARGSK